MIIYSIGEDERARERQAARLRETRGVVTTVVLPLRPARAPTAYLLCVVVWSPVARSTVLYMMVNYEDRQEEEEQPVPPSCGASAAWAAASASDTEDSS